MGNSLMNNSLDEQQMPTSMWQVKPWWCQPWSIVLTGLVVPTISWLLLHQLWITVPIAGIIVVWWVLFLGLVPAQYAAAIKATQIGNNK